MSKQIQKHSPSDDTALAAFGDGPIPGIGLANPARREAALATGTMLRRIVTLSEGMSLDGGQLIGEGAPVECRSPDGDTSKVRTWNFEMAPGVTVGILGSHQLDSELPALVGRRLYVEKGAMKRVNGRQVAKYVVIDLDATRGA